MGLKGFMVLVLLTTTHFFSEISWSGACQSAQLSALLSPRFLLGHLIKLFLQHPTAFLVQSCKALHLSSKKQYGQVLHSNNLLPGTNFCLRYFSIVGLIHHEQSNLAISLSIVPIHRHSPSYFSGFCSYSRMYTGIWRHGVKKHRWVCVSFSVWVTLLNMFLSDSLHLPANFIFLLQLSIILEYEWVFPLSIYQLKDI